MLINSLSSAIQRFLHGSALFGLVFLGLGIFAGIFACTPSATIEDEAARSQPQGPIEAAAPPVVKVPSLQEQPFRVQDLTVQEERGQTTIRIQFSDPVNQYRHFPLAQPSRIVLEVFGPAKQMSEVEEFRVETQWLGMLRLSSGEGHLRLFMDIAAATLPAYAIEPENGGLKITIGPIDPQRTAKRDVQLVQNGRRTDVRAAQTNPTASAASAGGGQPKTEKVYTGQKLSLDFKDADIKNVFRLLAEVSGLNIIVTDEVKKKVTIHLMDVPWDQAMDLLVETNGLGKEEVGNVVRISTAAQLKAEKDALSAAQKAQENLEPLQTAYLNVNYAKVKELEPKIKPLLSPRGTVVFDERSNTILVRDIRKGIDDVNTLISRLDTRTPQVLIESNLIETNPTFARALGIQFQFTAAGTTFGGAAGAGSPFTALLGAPGSPATGLGGIIQTIQGRVGGIKNLATALQSAENEGNIRIISRPSVVTLNNVASTIQSLRILRIVLPTSTNIASGTGAAAGAAVATEKIPIGIILTVTPQVSSDGFILMSISVKSSSVAPSPTVPAGGTSGVVPFDELTREAIANVLVKDGETIVIGGIMKDTKQTSESGIPWLKDIPVFGWLFKNMRWEKDFEELMVFITPRVVAAGSENLPTAEQLWRGRMSQTQGG